MYSNVRHKAPLFKTSWRDSTRRRRRQMAIDSLNGGSDCTNSQFVPLFDDSSACIRHKCNTIRIQDLTSSSCSAFVATVNQLLHRQLRIPNHTGPDAFQEPVV